MDKKEFTNVKTWMKAVYELEDGERKTDWRMTMRFSTVRFEDDHSLAAQWDFETHKGWVVVPANKSEESPMEVSL
jgi:hypothetical protein